VSQIALVGVGKLGLECGEVLAEHHSLVGFDLERRNPRNFGMAGSLGEAVRGARIVLVAVQTPHLPGYGGDTPTSHLPPQDFDYRPLRECVTALAPLLDRAQTVVIVSTVLPGTLGREIRPLLPQVSLLYNPYLIAMGSVQWDMRHPEMLIIGSEGGDRDQHVSELIEIYKPVAGDAPRLVIGTWEEAEAIKIFYNTFISAKISLANMILDVAERIGHTDVDVVTSALRDSTQRIMGPRYMHAGLGDAGPCHPRDNIALRHLAASLGLGYDLFEAIMTSREQQAANLAQRLVELSDKSGLPIVIHGKAYKPGLPYVDGSYSLLVAHAVGQRRRAVEFVDPGTDDRRSTTGPAVFLLAHNAEVSYPASGRETSDAAPFYCDIPAGSVVLDPWRRAPPMQGVTVIHYGNTRPAADREGSAPINLTRASL
jgi:UDPglucose 6-dehydrogenase